MPTGWTELSDKISFFNVPLIHHVFAPAAIVIARSRFLFRRTDHRSAAPASRAGPADPRRDGPQSHLVTKKGTPTMGGLMISLRLHGRRPLLWANRQSPMSGWCWA